MSRQRVLVWSSLALVALIAVGLAVANAVNPRPCASCHSGGTFTVQTKQSAHAMVDCKRCHSLPFTLSDPLHGYASTVKNASRDDASVPDSRCEPCHRAFLGGTVVAAKGISINHATCAVGAACTDCHSSVAHGTATSWVRSYDMDACLECHLVGDNVECDTCHVGGEEVSRVRSAFRITHGPKWKSMHGMGNVATCTVCHSARDCSKCHGAGVPHEARFIDAHSGYASESDARCSTCHSRNFCGDCHGTTMPHAKKFVREHQRTAKNDAELCERCHDEGDCTECHVKHVHRGGATGVSNKGGGDSR